MLHSAWSVRTGVHDTKNLKGFSPNKKGSIGCDNLGNPVSSLLDITPRLIVGQSHTSAQYLLQFLLTGNS